MLRRSWLASTFGFMGLIGLGSLQASQEVPSCRKPLTVTAVSERSVQVSGEKEDLKRFMRAWQSSLWPTWQSDLNADGTNAAIKQMAGIDADIEAGNAITFYNHGSEFNQAIGYALAKYTQGNS